MALVNFANLNATSEQKGNPGGIRTLLACQKSFIDGVWPKEADTLTGEITTLPTMKATAKFAAYECPDGTVEVSSEKQGDPGFQSFKHNIEFMLAGFSKTIQTELAKNMNAGSVYILEMNGGEYVVVGSSDNPIFSKQSFKGGKKGGDKRGFTLKGEQDGFMWDILPLKDTLIATIPIQAVV